MIISDTSKGCAESTRRRKQSLEPDALAIAEEEVARQEELARVYRVSERAAARDENCCTFGAQLLHAVELLRKDAELLRGACATSTATSWWTNFRIRISRSSNCCGCWRATGEYFRRGRRRSGNLPFPRRVVRQLHDFSRSDSAACDGKPAAAAQRNFSFRFRKITARRSASCAWRAQ